MVTKEEFRMAMGDFATGVTVITTNDDRGQPHAMTANSFTSVCLEPPVVLVCVAHSTNTHQYLAETGWFGVNILGQDLEDVGAYAESGVDFISLGAITHSAPALDISLNIVPEALEEDR